MRRLSPLLLLFWLMPGASFPAPAQSGWKEFKLGPATAKGPNNPRGLVSDRALRARSISPRILIAMATGVLPSRVSGPGWIDSERYAISAVLADDSKGHLRVRPPAGTDAGSEFQSLFAREIVARFRLEFERQRRQTSGFLVRLPPSSIIKARRSKANEGSRFRESGTPILNARRTLEVRGATLSEFVEWLERVPLRAPVAAAHPLPDGLWDFRIRWTTADRHSLFESVNGSVGLEIAPGDVAAEYVVIGSIDKVK